MAPRLRLDVTAVTEVAAATRPSEVIVTATTALAPFLDKDIVRAGAFVAAVGADCPDKSELVPDLTAGATIVVDSLPQAITMGDLHHAIDAGTVTAAQVQAELADVIVGRKRGRTSEDETIVFDSTATAIQDIASAVVIWQRAVERNAGSSIQFGEPPSARTR
jgi:alanine dehydrogenase